MTPGLSPRKAHLWLILGSALIAVGATLAAYPWFIAGLYGVPFGGPEAWALIPVYFIVVAAAVGIAWLWITVLRIERGYRW